MGLIFVFYYCIFVSGLVSSCCKPFMSDIIIVLLLLLIDNLKADDNVFKISYTVANINQLDDYLIVSKFS